MNNSFDSLISTNPNIKRVLKENLTFAVVSSEDAGMQLAKDLLSKIVDAKTIFLLSGGKTPQQLYGSLAEEGELIPGVVGLIDERFGEQMHENSNELMIKKTQMLSYLEKRNIPFYGMLHGKKREEEAADYDEKIRSLFATFPKSVGILGIGLDGHTAGLPAQISNYKSQISNNDEQRLVVSFDDFPGPQKERITMTFLGLSMIDLQIVLVFGSAKKEALDKMFQDGSEEEIPARFFKRQDIAQKTLFITDQNV
jgi:6-phosphogluconolactonase/glucosamine-6-phosphate isomerase/deaminase